MILWVLVIGLVFGFILGALAVFALMKQAGYAPPVSDPVVQQNAQAAADAEKARAQQRAHEVIHHASTDDVAATIERMRERGRAGK